MASRIRAADALSGIVSDRRKQIVRYAIAEAARGETPDPPAGRKSKRKPLDARSI